LHFQKFLLEVVAIGRKNAGRESDNTYVKNQRENLYGRGTITCETTIPKPRV
jgi:hypothetical protein